MLLEKDTRCFTYSEMFVVWFVTGGPTTVHQDAEACLSSRLSRQLLIQVGKEEVKLIYICFGYV